MLRFASMSVLVIAGAASADAPPCPPAFESKLVAHDPHASDRFGSAVAIDGEFAVIGAPLNWEGSGFAGAAYVARWNGAGWEQVQKLVAPSPVLGGAFGQAVAISGDTLVVTAQDRNSPTTNLGAAYVFRRFGDDWVWTQTLVPVGATENCDFGSPVALDGNTMVIGAPADDLQIHGGVAYVFRLSNDEWVFAQTISAADGQPGSAFGDSVSVSGGRIAVGAPLSDRGAPDAGAVYIFESAGSNSWAQAATPGLGVAFESDRFGESVALSGDRLVVGQPLGAGFAGGVVYVFRNQGGAWHYEKQILPPVDQPDLRFGTSVGVCGDRVVVGTTRVVNGLGEPVGGAWVYERGDGSWSPSGLVQPEYLFDDARFGSAVALSGDRLIVGAWGDSLVDSIEHWSTGSVSVFRLPGGGSFQAEPIDTQVDPGADAVFAVSFASPSPVEHRWLKNGAELTNGATPSGSVITGSGTPVLRISGATGEDLGLYNCEVTDACAVPHPSSAGELRFVGACEGDANSDLVVDFNDITAVLGNWLSACP